MDNNYGNFFGAFLTDVRGIVREEVKSIYIPSQPGSTSSRYKPIGKFCEEMDMTRANLYNLDKKGIIKLKKLGGKTFVDTEQVEEAMRDFSSKAEVDTPTSNR